MRKFLLSLELIDSPLLLVVAGVAGAGVVALLLWPPRRWLGTVLIAIGAGLLMYAVASVLEARGVFEGPLPFGAALWASAATAAAAVGIIGVCRRPWGRRVIGVVTVLAALLAGALGVNAAYGVTHTPAAVLGVQALDEAALPNRGGDGGDPATLYQRWNPPADMPGQGTVSALTGSTKMPTGQFGARDASLYLPPAALVPDAPALPLLVFMMGQPGSPDPTSLAKALNAFAASNRGLAPIAIVVDQLGAPDKDPACADSAMYGAVSTYINQLVPQWAEENLNVTTDHRYWTIGGFSNGGSCAAFYGSGHPDVWGNILDVSGNEYPGSEHVSETVADVYNGDATAFAAAKPSSLMAAAAPGTFAGHVAVFTWGGDDGTFGPGQAANAQAAQAAGFTTLTYVVPGAGHTGQALDAGLAWGVPALAPALGLSAPPAG